MILLPTIAYLEVRFLPSLSSSISSDMMMIAVLLTVYGFFSLLVAFLSEQKANTIAKFSIIFITVCVFYEYFSKVGFPWFVPNIPIGSALQVGNIALGLMAIVSTCLIGFLTVLYLSDDAKPSLIVGFGFGFGVIVVLSMILGFLTLIDLFWCSTLTVFALVLLIFLNRKKLVELFNRMKTISLSDLKKSLLPHLVPLSFTVIFLAVNFYFVIIYPAHEWDSLAYGPPYSALIYTNHSIPIIYGPSIGIEMSANYPPGVQLLAAYYYTFAGGAFDLYYRVSIFLFGISTLGIAYLTGKEYFGDSTGGWYTALPLLCIYAFIQFMDSTSYIIATAAAYSISLYFLVVWLKRGKTQYLVLSGIGAGIALLTSYEGLFAFAFAIVVILWIRKGTVKSLNSIVIFLASGSFSFIWLVRNWLVLGNPLYPMLGFGKGLVPLLYLSSKREIFYNGWGGFWNSFANLSAFLGGNSISMGPFFLIVLLLFILLFSINRKNKDFKEIGLFLLLGIAIPFVLSGINGFFARYFVLTVVPVGLSFSLIHRQFQSKFRPIFRKVIAVIMILGLVSTGMLVENVNSFPNRDVSSTSSYLAQTYGYDGITWNWVNTHTPPNSVIATYEIRTYYIDRPVVPLDGYSLSFLYNESMSPSEIYDGLRALNVSYIMSVSWTTAAGNSGAIPAAYFENPLIKYLGDPEYFHPVFVTPVDAVYSVSKTNVSMTATVLPSYSHVIVDKQMNISTAITNYTSPATSMLYLNLSPDFFKEPLLIKTNSSSNISIELWNGYIPYNCTYGWWNTDTSIAHSPNPTIGGANDPLLSTECPAGEYTLILVDWSPFTNPLNVTVSLSIPYIYPSV